MTSSTRLPRFRAPEGAGGGREKRCRGESMIHIPQDIDSKYRFITLAAQRCTQLMRGAKPRLVSRSHKATTIALEELLAGLVEAREGEGPWPEDEAVPLEPRPDAEAPREAAFAAADVEVGEEASVAPPAPADAVLPAEAPAE